MTDNSISAESVTPEERALVDGLRRVCDLSFFDFALLTHARDAEGRDYLDHWWDSVEGVDRRLVFRVTPADLEAFLSRRISLRDLLLRPADGFYYMVDGFQGVPVEEGKIRRVTPDGLDPSGLPDPDSFHDPDDDEQPKTERIAARTLAGAGEESSGQDAGSSAKEALSDWDRLLESGPEGEGEFLLCPYAAEDFDRPGAVSLLFIPRDLSRPVLALVGCSRPDSAEANVRAWRGARGRVISLEGSEAYERVTRELLLRGQDASHPGDLPSGSPLALSHIITRLRAEQGRAAGED